MTVWAIEKVLDNGTDLENFAIVIAGDGFTAAELPAFADAADDLIATMENTAPFSDPAVWTRINFYRMDVISAESGADNPMTCADDPANYVPAPPETALTAYEANYCNLWGGSYIRRLLVLDNDADLVADATLNVPAWDFLMCIVNHTEYGGSGGTVATCSVTPLASQIAIHELGHIFGLKDEYDGDAIPFSGPDPGYPNITTSTTGGPWAAAVTATNLPTWSSTDCAVSNDNSTDPEPGSVGTYEGALGYNCGIYRPSHDCMMRTTGSPFCAVCDAHIRGALEPLPFELCFVATAAYGDPGHPDVMTIRNWRNRHLQPGARNRHLMLASTKLYRVIGPPLALLALRWPRFAAASRRLIFTPLAARLRQRQDHHTPDPT
jgi:IgA Peptidase M64